jgi:IS6 family transposase
MSSRRCRPVSVGPCSAFKGFRFPPEIIVLAVRWYLRYGLSYRDVEELLAERGIEVDHVSVFRWVQCFTPLLADAARPCRHAVGSRWFVDETYVKVAGRWRYVYRAVDQHGQIIDVYVSARRDTRAARRFFETAFGAHGEPVEVVTDRAPALRAVIEELLPGTFHNTEQYANNRIEADHGRLKAWLRPMRGLKRDHTARSAVTRSCRTSAAATTNSDATPDLTDASRPRSTNSPEPSERTSTASGSRTAPSKSTQQSRCLSSPLDTDRFEATPRYDRDDLVTLGRDHTADSRSPKPIYR